MHDRNPSQAVASRDSPIDTILEQSHQCDRHGATGPAPSMERRCGLGRTLLWMREHPEKRWGADRAAGTGAQVERQEQRNPHDATGRQQFLMSDWDGEL